MSGDRREARLFWGAFWVDEWVVRAGMCVRVWRTESELLRTLGTGLVKVCWRRERSRAGIEASAADDRVSNISVRRAREWGRCMMEVCWEFEQVGLGYMLNIAGGMKDLGGKLQEQHDVGRMCISNANFVVLSYGSETTVAVLGEDGPLITCAMMLVLMMRKTVSASGHN